MLPPKRRIQSWVVNGCTSLNLVLGLATVWLSCHGNLSAAACCLLGSVVWDAADGFLARRWKVASDFGAQLDSLADLTSFGIGGGAFVLGWQEGWLPASVALPLAAWFGLTAAWRLARFNATPQRPGEFSGLPTTAVASLLAMGYLSGACLHGWAGAALLALLAGLMISSLPYPKFTRVGELPPWVVVLAFLGGALHLQWTVWLGSALYLLTGPWLWWRRRQQSLQLIPG
jgi:CDP-diacylglycerol--serine O-phosphatidyltransferase